MTAPLDDATVRNFASSAGFTGNNLDIALAISHAESGCILDSTNTNSNGSVDRGLWQINSIHSQWDHDRLLSDGLYNAQAAFAISSGGANWTPWATFVSQKNKKTGLYMRPAYLAFMPAATGAPSATAGAVPANVANTTAPVPAAPQQTVIQPDFDKRMYRISQTRYAPALYHGVIALARDGTPAGQVVRFLYNPFLITMSYNASNTQIPTGQDDPTQAGLPLASNTTISFSLFFDRTYEVNAGSTTGVLDDIVAMESLCGITQAAPFMQLNRVKFIFGTPLGFQYFAVMQNFTVQYNHFSPEMVPMRCEVDITATRLAATTDLDTGPLASVTAPGTIGNALLHNPLLMPGDGPSVTPPDDSGGQDNVGAGII